MESNSFTNEAEIQTSLKELSKEMDFLGLQLLAVSDYSRPVEVCESLLNAAWNLVHTIHCLSNSRQNDFQEERESRLRDEKHLLEVQLHQVEDKVKLSDRKLALESESNLKLKAEVNKLRKALQQQKHQVDCLQKRILRQEDLHKHNILKQEVENSYLRNLINHRHQGVDQPREGKIDEAVASLSISGNAETQMLEKNAMCRLMSSNQELISENLTLRDALRNIHADATLLLKTANSLRIILGETIAIGEDPFPENAFRQPLSHGMKVLSKLRETQISSLNEALSQLRSFVLQHTLELQ